jgi:hypothetical protein
MAGLPADVVGGQPVVSGLSRSTLNYIAALIRRRKKIGSTWRLLNPRYQALLVLAYLRKGETFAEISAGFGVSAIPPGRM